MLRDIDRHWSVEQDAPVGPQIYRILRERIIRSDLEPGSRLSEAEIARAYRVSRQPVREAFIKLAEEGLLEVRPQRGSFVRKISVSAVMGARFVREAIEADVAALLAQQPDPALIAALREQIQAQSRAVDAPARFMSLDERFHRSLAEAAGQHYAWRVLEDVKAQMDRVRFLSALRFPIRKLVEQHTAVVDAIERGDAPAAGAAMRRHLREILRDLPSIAAAKADYFEADETLTKTRP